MSDCPCPPGDMEEPDWADAGVTDADELADARRHWRIIVDELAGQQTLAEANRHAIGRLVLEMILYERAQKLVLKEGLTVKFKNGTSQQHPALSIANKKLALIAKLEADLGITVIKRLSASKGKVAGKAKKKPGGGDAIEF